MLKFIDLSLQQKEIEGALQARMQAVLEHGQYIMGPEVLELESVLADYVGVRHCITVSSGTDALLLALMVLGVGPGDEVVTTPFSFFATGEVIAFLGAKAHFVDISPHTYQMDPNRLESVLHPGIKAIIPVSLYGQTADFTAINALAARYAIPVIEDAAQSFGALHHGKRSGGLSTVGCTSFFPSKPLGCYGDGGACFTDNDRLAEQMRSLRIHGQTQRYCHSHLGVNARFDTLQAAVLLAKWPRFAWEVERREKIGARYTELLSSVCQTPVIAPGNTHVYGQYTIALEDRDSVREALSSQGIPTAVHYPTLIYEQPAWRSDWNASLPDCPHAHWASRHVMSLPMYPDLSIEHQQCIVQSVVSALESVLV